MSEAALQGFTSQLNTFFSPNHICYITFDPCKFFLFCCLLWKYIFLRNLSALVPLTSAEPKLDEVAK